MWRSTISSTRAHLGRLVAAALAIVLGTGFVAGTFVGTGALAHQVRAQFAASTQPADVVVSPPSPGGDIPLTALTRVRQTPGVRAAAGNSQLGVSVGWPDGSSPFGSVVRLPADTALRWERVLKGTLPSSVDDVAVDDRTVTDTGLHLGDSLRVADQPGAPGRTVRVVGVVNAGGNPQASGDRTLFAAPTAAWAQPPFYDTVSVAATAGTSRQQLVSQLHASLGRGYSVLTADAYADRQAKAASGGSVTLGAVLLVFAAIALFVAGIVITNTFTILLAQRSREMALLRCVGATRGQVFGSVGREALLLGAAASAIGAVVGTVLTIVGFNTLGPGHAAPSATGAVVSVVLGVLVTLIAAITPAVRATRIAPLAALRPAQAPTIATRVGRVRALLGMLTLGVGLLLLVAGALQHIALIGIAGGMISFVAVLVVAPVLIPALGRVLGLLGRPFGVPGRLAAANAVRNPQRAASTATALLVGVTLLATMSVGAASAKSTSAALLRQTFPLDVSLDSGASPLQQSVLAGGPRTSGIDSSAALRTADVTIGGEQISLAAGDAAAMRRTLHSAIPLADLRPGVLLVSSDAAIPGATTGRRVTVRAGTRSAVLTVRVVRHLPDAAITSPADLRTLAPRAPVAQLWLRAAHGADAQTVHHRITDLARIQPGLEVGGQLAQQADLAHAVDEILLVVTALLAIAVVIAFVGVANTMALSVLERARESALLRALGLTRSQLRAMFAAEAVLLASVGALLGIALGVLYGWAGTLALLGQGQPPVIAVPWGRLVVFAVVAGVAGLAASVVPSIRACRVTPAAALATD